MKLKNNKISKFPTYHYFKQKVKNLESAVGTYTVTYTIAAAGGCAAVTSTASVTISAGPTATISYASPFCSTNTTDQLPTITGTSGGTFSPIAGVTIDATTGAITPNTATVGTYTITYTIPVSGGCAVYTATTTISIVASFTSSISYTSPVCSSASVVAPTITGSIGGTFSSTAGLTIASATGIITPTTSTAGTYTITYNIPASGGCAAFSTTTTITITAASVATISYTSPFCSINSVVQNATLTGLAGGTYSSTAGLTINTITGGITPNTSAAGTYVITYTIAATATCPVFTTTASITITSAPTATIAYSSPFCSTNLTVQNPTITGTTGGSFSSTVGLTINPTTGGITPNSSTAGSYVVTYTIAAIGGCIVFTTTANVTITAAPTATISYTTSFCSTNTTVQNPTITGSTGGSFTSTAGLIINSSKGGITPNTSTSGTYTVTYSILATATCPTFSATTSVTITSSPTATIAYNGPYCANLATTQSTTLTGSNGGTFSSTLGLSLNSATGLITPNTSTAGTYTVTYTIPASGGCAIFSTTASVTITPQQNAGFNYSAASFCRSGTNPVANITGITGGNFTSSPVGLVFLNSSNGQIDLLASTANNYSITYTTAGPCPSSSTFSLSLTNSPNADFSYPNQFYCIDAVNPLITLAAGAVAGLFSSSPAGLSINPTTGVVNFASSIAGSYTISNTIAAASGCSAVVFSTTLTLIDLPIATATSTTVCENGIASLAATGGTTYSWTGPNGFTSTLQNPIIDSVSFADTGTYTVIATVLSCTASAEVTLLINPLPSISVGNNVSILEETSTVLTASGGGPYLWVPNNTLSCDTCSKVTATPTQTTTYCISKINPLTGCENEDCVTVTIVIPCREIFVPNAFSPNQDGENELECVFGTCFSTFNFNIFNRWGELVFSSQDQKFCWDGKYKGELCPTAVYVYSLTGTLTTGESVKKEGNISLIR